MTLNAFIFTQEQRDLIAAAEARTGSQDCWHDEQLTALRQDIKRHYLREQANFCCYCQSEIPVNHLRAWDLDHIAARVDYPQFTFEPLNLAISCIDCNTAKSGYDSVRGKAVRYPVSSLRFRIVHAHYDSWEDHIDRGKFRFSGRTKKGSETIYRCDLFRFYENAAGTRNSIRDRRFEQEVENLLFATSIESARDSLRLIAARLKNLTVEEDIDDIIED